MFKPKSLRNALTDAVPVLKNKPRYAARVYRQQKGYSTLATYLLFENKYTLNVIVTDFSGDTDLILVPIFAWLRVN